MPLSDDSSEISPSLAEFTAQSVPAATTVTTIQSTSTAPTAISASDGTDRPVFPVTILGPTNSFNQAPPNRHNADDDDVHTTRQQDNDHGGFNRHPTDNGRGGHGHENPVRSVPKGPQQVGGFPVEDKTVAPSNRSSCQPVLWQATR